MLGLTRRWTFRTTDGSGTDPGPLVERICRARGIADSDDIRRFCEPSLHDLHDPGLMPNIDLAAQRLVDAVRRREKIVIYGDYDVDGITASAILYHILRTVDPDADVHCYVPHRLEEGYGLNVEAIRGLHADGADLIVTVDCGITARTSAAVARQLGVDLIITDHHHVPQAAGDGDDPAALLPDALAVVHPRLALPDGGPTYPYGDLSGAGVAFKLAWRFATTWCGSPRVSETLKKALLDVLPLAALGTIADVVPLVGENRVIASWGLKLIRHCPLLGVRALIESAGLAGASIDSQKVGFVLGPRLNACGRMGHAAEVVRMLTQADPFEAREIANRLNAINDERRATERRIVEQAAAMAIDAGMTDDGCHAIVLAHDDWHPGVLGIACSRLADRFNRPTVLLQRNGEYCKGSARSIPGWSIHAALATMKDLYETFGGHDMAAGLTIAKQHYDRFARGFLDEANRTLTGHDLIPQLTIDCEADLAELDPPTVSRLTKLAPFGRDNPHPCILIRNAQLVRPAQRMGREGRHLDLRICAADADVDGKWLRCIWWNEGRFASDLAVGMRLDLALEPCLDSWNGRTRVQGEIRDARVTERAV